MESPTPRPGVALSGAASWYCKAGRSVCHHAYPDTAGTDLYAAACGRLRGEFTDWRGRTVTVGYRGREVKVVLIDWCGHPDRMLDLYWDAANALGITGVGRVDIYVK